jgi:hypothetical protein
MKKLTLAVATLLALATIATSVNAQNRICSRVCNPQGTYCTTTCY